MSMYDLAESFNQDSSGNIIVRTFDVFFNGVDVSETGITESQISTQNRELKIVAHSGWVFKHTLDSTVENNTVIREYRSGLRLHNFTFNESSSEGVITTDSTSQYWSWLYVEMEQTAPEVVAGVNNIYCLPVENLEAFAQARFSQQSVGDVNKDYDKYIINLMLLPINLPDEVESLEESIKLADYSLNVSATRLNTDILKYNLGEISVPSNGSLKDYSNKSIKLYLPYYGVIDLDPTYIIGETITILYYIDCYTGLTTINILSTYVDASIITLTCDIGFNIPMANLDGNKAETLLASSGNIKGDNLLLTPFIEFIDLNSNLNNGFFNTPIMDDVILSEVTGFFTVINANLILKATSSEKSQIQSMLQSGVIYK